MPVAAGEPEQAPALRQARGLVFFRLAARVRGPIPFGWVEDVLARQRDGPDPPPYGAVAWSRDGRAWSIGLGGRWLEKGDGRLVWEWIHAG